MMARMTGGNVLGRQMWRALTAVSSKHGIWRRATGAETESKQPSGVEHSFKTDGIHAETSYFRYMALGKFTNSGRAYHDTPTDEQSAVQWTAESDRSINGEERESFRDQVAKVVELTLVEDIDDGLLMTIETVVDETFKLKSLMVEFERYDKVFVSLDVILKKDDVTIEDFQKELLSHGFVLTKCDRNDSSDNEYIAKKTRQENAIDY